MNFHFLTVCRKSRPRAPAIPPPNPAPFLSLFRISAILLKVLLYPSADLKPITVPLSVIKENYYHMHLISQRVLPGKVADSSVRQLLKKKSMHLDYAPSLIFIYLNFSSLRQPH